ncbi:rab3 GTPase-activating protein catalytic subunit [Elysia marginata]|uniref:Rab3 GTPase-activating protein catalytic subunit n=1 Tax=Elysia marginata TaxID=1093978 RepID=A0AAV4JAP1_9GAST|nr:rab3 GTPase-activating protein catalytic subunit [Elysia marginata]
MSETVPTSERNRGKMSSNSRDSMISVEDEADVFEITDFTTASDWERFIARLEEILHEWKLVNHKPRPPAMKDQYATGTWTEKSEEVVFADFRFTFTYLYLKIGEDTDAETGKQTQKGEDEDSDEDYKTPTVFLDLMNFDNDFPSRAHFLCRWYGLQEILTLTPVSEKQSIDSESRAKLLLSSASIALGNSTCSIPFFVQLQSRWRKLFTGTSLVKGGATVEFEMSHLKRLPSQFCHLAGLLDVFKSKLGCTYISMPPVSVSVRFTYILSDWIHGSWPQIPPDFSSSFCDGEVGYGDIDFLPFGACLDPINELHLSCTWPCLSEDMIVENSLYSDLDPLQAPQWSVRLQMTDNPQCLLGDFLNDFLKLSERHESTEEILKKVLPETDSDKDKANSEISNVLQRLTEPVPALSSVPSLGNVVSSASAKMTFRPEDAPIPDELLGKILIYLFPDAKTPRSAEEGKPNPSAKLSDDPSTSVSEASGEAKAPSEHISDVAAELNKKLKSSPTDSLTHKLSLALCHVNHQFGGLLAVAHLWQEFILEMRFRWENKILLCGIEKGAPNLGSCILHQKLQMLNCCIECKVKRESSGFGYGPDSLNIHSNPSDSVLESTSTSDTQNSLHKVGSLASSSGDDEDDEFFECEEDDDEDEAGDEDQAATQKKALEPHEAQRQKKESKSSADDDVISTRSDASQYQDSRTHRPEGRMVPMKNYFLLCSGEQLYIPITQEPSPMTEDMLEEHAEVLAKLGTTAEGSQIRARMQSACLVSDMESFKAANPGCILEDFVRWYSPRDYIVTGENGEEVPVEEGDGETSGNPGCDTNEEGEVNSPDSKGDVDGGTANKKTRSVQGKLSQRMQIPGNMWVEAWQSARAVPARRQKRLFDDTREAEKVLHYLSSMRPAEVVLHLMPNIVHAAVSKVAGEAVAASVPNAHSMLNQLVSRAATLTRSFSLDRHKYREMLHCLELAETISARTTSLRSKFTSNHLSSPAQEGKEEEIEGFVTSLLTQGEVSVRGGACGPAGAIIHKMFIAAQRSNNMILDDEEGLDILDSLYKKPLSRHASDRRTSNSSNHSATSSTGTRKNSDLSMPSPTQEVRSSASCADFPPASVREYILRAMVPRPAPYSKVLPQRMYCMLTDGDNRLAGAFTSDSTFQ